MGVLTCRRDSSTSCVADKGVFASKGVVTRNECSCVRVLVH